jgi:DNA polymerase-1
VKRTLLIDGDEFVHVCSSAVEYEARWDDQNIILASNVEEAWDAFLGRLKTVHDAIEGEKVLRFAFTGSENFRKSLYPDYKAKRSGRKPLCFSDLKGRVHENFDCHTEPSLEADDLLGIWSTDGNHENPVVISQDKDMLTLPTTIWRDGGLVVLGQGDADFHWLKQTLTGDTSDGYPGCPGFGPVSAEKLLDTFVALDGSFLVDEAWKAIVQHYEKKGLSAADALTQARLARILRATDWDEEKREVKLWTPN